MTLRSPSVWLALALLAALWACATEEGPLVCASEPAPTLLVGTATFQGETQQFDEASGVLIMRGPQDDPCLDFVSIIARNESKAIELQISVDAQGGYTFGGANYGASSSPEQYGLYPDDESKFAVTWALDELDADCAQASATVIGTGGRMFVHASEDFGPYDLDAVEVSVEGQFRVEWFEGSCD